MVDAEPATHRSRGRQVGERPAGEVVDHVDPMLLGEETVDEILQAVEDLRAAEPLPDEEAETDGETDASSEP